MSTVTAPTPTASDETRYPARTARLLERLRAAGLRIAERGQGPLAPQLASAPDVDVLVVRPESLTEEDLAAIDAASGDAHSPSVVVLGADVPDHARATLIAGGVTHVVEGRLGQRWLRNALDAVARAETESASVHDEPRLSDFLSRSTYMRRFVALVRKVVDVDSTLLVTGETGVGKERLSRAIHAEGTRSDGPFVAVNCGALPEQLLESELFGHVKGAFTGADSNRDGHFVAADGGTLFLDEIGELPLSMQVKLLTVLERHEVTQVGSSTPKSIDVRVLAATNRDLRDEVLAGRFREDLYYRLNVVPLEIPSLRQRREDIPDLVGSLIAWYRRELERDDVHGIEPDALDVLMDYAWPGNVRELSNAIERALLLCEGTSIGVDDLPPEVRGGVGSLDAAVVPGASDGELRPAAPTDATLGALAHAAAASTDAAPGLLPANWRELPLKDVRQSAADRVEREYLDRVMTDVRGVIKDAAERCGIAPRSLYDRLRRHGIKKEDYR